MSGLSRFAFKRRSASCARARLFDRSVHESLGRRRSARDREVKIQGNGPDSSRGSHSRDSTATSLHGDRLAAQLGSNLRGVLYVLDEPTIGLHPRDNQRLLETLTTLRNKGNSLLVVEHDEETIRCADHIVDLGPRAGIHGGEVVTSGTLNDVQKNPNSETARCLKSPLCHPIRGSRRSLHDVENWIEIHGASANNLKNIDVRFPVGRLSVITGISGSGKSTLMHEIILPAVRASLGSARVSRAGERVPRSRTTLK